MPFGVGERIVMRYKSGSTVHAAQYNAEGASGVGRIEHDTGRTMPPALAFASEDASGPTAVHVPVHGRDTYLVIEPGHDPELLWKGVMAFFAREGLG